MVEFTDEQLEATVNDVRQALEVLCEYYRRKGFTIMQFEVSHPYRQRGIESKRTQYMVIEGTLSVESKDGGRINTSFEQPIGSNTNILDFVKIGLLDFDEVMNHYSYED